ncbi:MAG: hypothetical protein ABDH61_03740 [Acidilobaceae archaeon]
MAKANARLVGGRVLVDCRDEEFCKALEKQGYLEGGEMEALELLYQLSQEVVELNGESGWEALLHAARELSLRFSVFLVYMDLRKKGRWPRRSVRKDSLLLRLPSGKTGEVLVLEEGEGRRLEEVIEWVRAVQAMERVPLLAVVDKAGVISYYEARALKKLG